jgi:hypothetical protein
LPDSRGLRRGAIAATASAAAKCVA